MSAIEIGPAIDEADRAWLARLWRDEWGGEVMITRGRMHRLHDLTALIARIDGECAGAATYEVQFGECELTSINAAVAGRGIGSDLLRAVEQAARGAGCDRVWMITTNDNVDALRFYQRRGYRIVAIHAGAVDEARRVKPAIPAHWVLRDSDPRRDRTRETLH
jgi:GNAT superfamily N-acetyltransferase